MCMEAVKDHMLRRSVKSARMSRTIASCSWMEMPNLLSIMGRDDVFVRMCRPRRD